MLLVVTKHLQMIISSILYPHLHIYTAITFCGHFLLITDRGWYVFFPLFHIMYANLSFSPVVSFGCSSTASILLTSFSHEPSGGTHAFLAFFGVSSSALPRFRPLPLEFEGVSAAPCDSFLFVPAPFSLLS